MIITQLHGSVPSSSSGNTGLGLVNHSWRYQQEALDRLTIAVPPVVFSGSKALLWIAGDWAFHVESR